MTRYFHGGAAGLRIGDQILPPEQTGARRAAEFGDYPPGAYRPDRVYLITDPTQARMFAALHPSGDAKRGGDVYRVEPEGSVEPDPDYLAEDGASVTAASARIVGIVATGVRRAPYRHLIEQAGP